MGRWRTEEKMPRVNYSLKKLSSCDGQKEREEGVT